jgi:hypothetical protein
VILDTKRNIFGGFTRVEWEWRELNGKKRRVMGMGGGGGRGTRTTAGKGMTVGEEVSVHADESAPLSDKEIFC